MAVKIRLSRHGRKRRPFYHIIIADSRAPRDGRFIERIGSYNPITDPATIDLDVDRALDWVQKGAQPTNTCRRILSYKGVYLRKHLNMGVAKGAFDQEEAQRRFDTWMQEKESKIEARRQELREQKASTSKSRLEAESKVNAARAEALREKMAEAAKKAEQAAASAAEATESPEAAETPAE